MKAAGWKRKILEQMQAVSTYRESFLPSVNALAEILAQREQAYKDFLSSGEGAVVTRISDRGSENTAKNPRLQVWIDLNNQALAYWRDLGLTPAGLKKIDEDAMKAKKRSALAEALKDLSG